MQLVQGTHKFHKQIISNCPQQLIILYKTLIRPVVSYGAESMVVDKERRTSSVNFWKENI